MRARVSAMFIGVYAAAIVDRDRRHGLECAFRREPVRRARRSPTF
ncbi:hypothetical protein [Lysobacter gummosus]